MKRRYCMIYSFAVYIDRCQVMTTVGIAITTDDMGNLKGVCSLVDFTCFISLCPDCK